MARKVIFAILICLSTCCFFLSSPLAHAQTTKSRTESSDVDAKASPTTWSSSTTSAFALPTTLQEFQMQVARQEDQMIAVLNSGGGGSQIPNGPIFGTDDEEFNINLFQAELDQGLADNGIGYSYAINLNGNLHATGAGGFRRTTADGGNLLSSATKRMHIASVTKNITATTLLAALSEIPGVDVNAYIDDYLPTMWAQGAGISNIRLRHLLTHSSGIPAVFGASTTYSNLKNTIATGVVSPGVSSGYDNRNFGLLRVILPYLVCPDVMQDAEIVGFSNGNYDEYIDQVTSDLYVYLVKYYVFNKIGVVNANTKPNANDAGRTRFYQFPDDGSPGQDGGDWTKKSGGAGWVLSAVDLAAYMAFRRYSNVIVSNANSELMDNERYGWQTIVGTHGTYLRHGGAFDASGPLRAQIMQFPIEVEVAVLVNSNLSSSSLQNIIKNAYDAAWE